MTSSLTSAVTAAVWTSVSTIVVIEIVAGLLADLRSGATPSAAAGRFHLTLAQMIGAVAEWHGLPRVVLSGGCFQNAALVTLAVRDLRTRGFQVVTASRIPPNDGGLAVGQALVAAHTLLERRG